MTLHAGWKSGIALGFLASMLGGCPQTAATSASEDAAVSVSEESLGQLTMEVLGSW